MNLISNKSQRFSSHINYYIPKMGTRDVTLSGSRKVSSGLPLCLAATVFALGKEEEEEDVLVTEVKKAKLGEMREKYSLAEEHYHAALRINDEQLKNGQVDNQKHIAHRAWILDAMANLAMTENKPYKAEKLFKEVVQLLVNLGAPPAAPAVLEISIKLANIYAVMEEDEKKKLAETGFRFCIDSQKTTVDQIKKWREQGEQVPETAVKEALALLGWAHESYAKFLLEQRRIDEGIAVMESSISIANEVYGDESENFASMLNDAASQLAEKNLWDQATKLLERSLGVAKDKGWEGEAVFNVNLGMIHLQQKLFDNAEKYCKHGLELGKRLKSGQAVEEADFCLTELKKARSA